MSNKFVAAMVTRVLACWVLAGLLFSLPANAGRDDDRHYYGDVRLIGVNGGLARNANGSFSVSASDGPNRPSATERRKAEDRQRQPLSADAEKARMSELERLLQSVNPSSANLAEYKSLVERRLERERQQLTDLRDRLAELERLDGAFGEGINTIDGRSAADVKRELAELERQMAPLEASLKQYSTVNEAVRLGLLAAQEVEANQAARQVPIENAVAAKNAQETAKKKAAEITRRLQMQDEISVARTEAARTKAATDRKLRDLKSFARHKGELGDYAREELYAAGILKDRSRSTLTVAERAALEARIDSLKSAVNVATLAKQKADDAFGAQRAALRQLQEEARDAASKAKQYANSMLTPDQARKAAARPVTAEERNALDRWGRAREEILAGLHGKKWVEDQRITTAGDEIAIAAERLVQGKHLRGTTGEVENEIASRNRKRSSAGVAEQAASFGDQLMSIPRNLLSGFVEGGAELGLAGASIRRALDGNMEAYQSAEKNAEWLTRYVKGTDKTDNGMIGTVTNKVGRVASYIPGAIGQGVVHGASSIANGNISEAALTLATLGVSRKIAPIASYLKGALSVSSLNRVASTLTEAGARGALDATLLAAGKIGAAELRGQSVSIESVMSEWATDAAAFAVTSRVPLMGVENAAKKMASRSSMNMSDPKIIQQAREARQRLHEGTGSAADKQLLTEFNQAHFAPRPGETPTDLILRTSPLATKAAETPYRVCTENVQADGTIIRTVQYPGDPLARKIVLAKDGTVLEAEPSLAQIRAQAQALAERAAAQKITRAVGAGKASSAEQRIELVNRINVGNSTPNQRAEDFTEYARLAAERAERSERAREVLSYQPPIPAASSPVAGHNVKPWEVPEVRTTGGAYETIQTKAVSFAQQRADAYQVRNYINPNLYNPGKDLMNARQAQQNVEQINGR